MKFLLAIDQGTTSTKALVVDSDGRIVARSHGDFNIEANHPRPGRVELDPERMFDTVCRSARSAVEQAGIGLASIAAIGLANQGETVIAFDAADGRPIHPAISWQDRRGEAYTSRWRHAGREPLFLERAGLPLDPYFSAPKLAWILDHVGEARTLLERGRLRLGTSDAWLLWRLSGGKTFATDCATASRTALLDLGRGCWSDVLCDAASIPAATLPTIRSNTGVFGRTQAEIFGVEIPITGLCVDQQAALFGHRCFTAGRVKATYGTGCFVLANIGDDGARRAPGLITCIAWQLGGRTAYALDGGIYSAGSVVDWLVELGLLTGAGEAGDVAAGVADSGGVFLIPAFHGLAAPHWQSRARACWAGMSAATDRRHLVRAALEGIAYRVADIVGAIRKAGIEVERLSVDGGLAACDFLMQMQADVLGVAVERSASTELTGFGTALLAGLGAGVWRSVDELPALPGAAKVFLPEAKNRAVVASRYESWSRIRDEVSGWGARGLTGDRE
jgi:glycerol kinase